MPIYVYRNLTTGETFEFSQRITESALTEHPETGDPVKRLIQPVGIAFKGSGFYVNDSRNTKRSAAKGAGSSNGSTPSGSDDAKTSSDTKTPSDSGKTSASSEGSKSAGSGTGSSAD